MGRGGAYGTDCQRGGQCATEGVDSGRWSAGRGRSEDQTNRVDRCWRCKTEFDCAITFLAHSSVPRHTKAHARTEADWPSVPQARGWLHIWKGAFLARHIWTRALLGRGPPSPRLIGLSSVCVAQVVVSSAVPPCLIARPSVIPARPPPSPGPPSVRFTTAAFPRRLPHGQLSRTLGG